jgi:hypothetical protein
MRLKPDVSGGHGSGFRKSIRCCARSWKKPGLIKTNIGVATANSFELHHQIIFVDRLSDLAEIL